MPRKRRSFTLAKVIPCRCLSESIPVVYRVRRIERMYYGLPLVAKTERQTVITEEVINRALEWARSLGKKHMAVIVAQDQSNGPTSGRITLISPYDPDTDAFNLENVIDCFRQCEDRRPIAILEI